MFPYFYLFTAALVFLSCTDPRRDQREENLFDPDNAFIRFDFENDIRGTAKDSIVLANTLPDTLKIPVALSSIPLSESVETFFSVTIDGPARDGEHFRFFGSNGEELTDRKLILEPGTFDDVIYYTESKSTPVGESRIVLQLEQVIPDFIHLGFPGHGRGRRFEIILRN